MVSHICKRILCVICLLLLGTALASGVVVKVNENARFYKSASTDSESVSIPKGTQLTLKDHAGSWAKVSWKGVDGYMPVKYLNADTRSDSEPDWCARVIKLSWSDGGGNLLKKGKYGYIYDIDTGIVVHIKRSGGSGHAECEPAGKSDTVKLKKLSGGSFSGDPHAVILYAGGKFVACSVCTRPQGEQTISNNGYPGQFCLYMSGCRDHEGKAMSAAHEKSIARAYKWAH